MPLAACLIPASAHCGMFAMASLNLACSVCAALPAHLGGGASSAGGYSLVKCRLSRDQSPTPPMTGMPSKVYSRPKV